MVRIRARGDRATAHRYTYEARGCIDDKKPIAAATAMIRERDRTTFGDMEVSNAVAARHPACHGEVGTRTTGRNAVATRPDPVAAGEENQGELIIPSVVSRLP